jgi:hypothetical protein
MKTRAIARTALAAALLGLGGCGTEIWLEEGEAATVEVRPVDAAGKCVLGVSLEFTYPGGRTERQGANGTVCSYGSQGPSGEWRVAITPAPGYALAPGQESVVHVRATARRRKEVPVRLIRTAP